MENLPPELQDHINSYRQVHPLADIMSAFIKRIQFSPCSPLEKRPCCCCLDPLHCGDCEPFTFAVLEYRSEPDYFDNPHGNRACVRAFYGWGSEVSDMRLHGSRGAGIRFPSLVVVSHKDKDSDPDEEWEYDSDPEW
jgi:hypothetical protein